MGGQDFNEKFYRMCQKTDDLHSAVFDKGGIRDTLGTMSVEHAACMRKHADEEADAKQSKKSLFDRKFAILTAIASSPVVLWIFEKISNYITKKQP